MRQLRKTLHVSCQQCGRVRRVSVRSPAARAWAEVLALHKAGKKLNRASWAARVLKCRTCKLLLSIEMHRWAIRELEAKVIERRSRGL